MCHKAKIVIWSYLQRKERRVNDHSLERMNASFDKRRTFYQKGYVSPNMKYLPNEVNPSVTVELNFTNLLDEQDCQR